MLFHNVIPVFVLLVAAIIAAQLAIGVWVVGTICFLRSDNLCWVVFMSITIGLIFMITIALLDY